MTTAWGGRGGAAAGIPEALAGALNRFDGAGDQIRARYVGRDRVVRVLQLAAVCRENVLLLGRPGTAKTDLVAAFGRQLEEAVVFHALLSRFSEPAELFGPVDVAAFKRNHYRVSTDGMLPAAHFAILDEIFQGSGAILNTLLSILGERRFHNGADGRGTVPLVVLVGTANDLPSDPALEAFTDRFLLRVRVAPVAADHFDDLLAVGAGIEQQRLDVILEEQRRSRAAGAGGAGGAGGAAGSAGPAGSPGFGARPYRASRGDRSAGFTLDDLDQITAAVSEVDVAKVHDPYRALVHELLRQGVELSDRRIVLGLKLIRAAALLDHRLRARPADLWPLAHFWTDEGDEPLVAEAVRAVVAEDGGDPGMPGVSARMLALRAADYFRAFQAGDFSPGTVDDTLKRLSHLRRTIEDHHPSAPEEREEISVLIRKVQTYYNPAGPGPGAANPSAHGSP